MLIVFLPSPDNCVCVAGCACLSFIYAFLNEKICHNLAKSPQYLLQSFMEIHCGFLINYNFFFLIFMRSSIQFMYIYQNLLGLEVISGT